TWERRVREVVDRTPRIGVTRVPREFPAPEKRHRIIQLAARRSAVHLGCERLPEQPGRGVRIAGRELAKCLMPADVAIKLGVARIGGEPRRKEGAGRLGFALLVAEMRAGVRSPRVVRVLRERAVDLRMGGGVLSVLRERHAMMGGEPPIVAIAWGKTIQK